MLSWQLFHGINFKDNFLKMGIPSVYDPCLKPQHTSGNWTDYSHTFYKSTTVLCKYSHGR